MRSICISIVATLALAGTTLAATIYVPGDYTTIQAAVDAASSGDEVVVAPGTYTGTGNEVVNMRGMAITLRATGTPEETILDGEDARAVVNCTSGEGADTIIEGFTITNGYANDGGGIYCRLTSPTITDCTISNNTADGGGGIYCYQSSPTLTDCTISNNTADWGGGASYGGGIYCYDNSSPTITECTIEGNTAYRGGGIYCYNSSNPTITECTITSNTADYGGGISCYYSSPAITGCTISNNTADYGGGIYCWESNPTITDCTILGNTANYDGGGIYCNGGSSPTITECTITDNTADGGGGIYCWESSPTITDCTISDNTAYNGGGIYCYGGGNPTITGCMISNNTAGYDGGGICCIYSGPTITDCTISNNTAADYGGGIYFYDTGKTLLLNSTVCGNSPNQIVGPYSDEGGNTVAAVCPIPGACCTNGECVIAEQADCLAFHGTWLGEGTACDDSSCPTSCLGDVTGDGQVNVNDLLTLLANWGPCP